MADVLAFARSLYKEPGVTGVWKLDSFDGWPTLWVLVRGFDEEAFNNRLAVRRKIEDFIRQSEYISYYVEVDEPGIGAPQIPASAEPVAETAPAA